MNRTAVLNVVGLTQDLKTRLFRYPCSYLIYSDSVMALPEPAKRYLVQRMRQILSGADRSPEFAHLSAEDRTAILEILRDTHPLLWVLPRQCMEW